MRFLFSLIVLSMLSGCVSSTLTVTGNAPMTRKVAEIATRMHGDIVCNKGMQNEQRSAKTATNNRGTNVDVRHSCSR